MEDTPQKEMPQYRSHKVVRALQIARVEVLEEGAMIWPVEDYQTFLVNEDYLKKHNPRHEGYYVVYEDGYASWSPAKAFEEGYTRII